MVESEKTVRSSFMSGVLWLSLSTLLVKLIGLLYKIPMLSCLGAVGMGYFHSAYELYALFCIIATAGLPVALSVLISAAIARADREEVQRIDRSSMRIFLMIGIGGSAMMLLLAKGFCSLIQSEGAYPCVLAISPTVLLICISSAYRGYFQGHQKMAPTAISQLIEALGKLLLGVFFAKWAYGRGMDTPQIAVAAGWGLTLGTAVATLYLMLEKRRFAALQGETSWGTVSVNGKGLRRALARLAIPMTLGASAVSLTKLIDMGMILRRLQAIGYSETMANEIYGSYTALALSVYGLIPSLVNAVALPLIPGLSAAIERGETRRQGQLVMLSYRLTALFAVPAALGVSAFAKPILTLLFGREPEAVESAAPLLSLLGVSVFLSCMITATNSVLHAYRSVNRPILSALAGAAVKLVAAYFLIGSVQVGIYGAPISTFLCNLTVVILNLIFVARLCPADRITGVLWAPLGASSLAVGLPYLCYCRLLQHVERVGMLTVACLTAVVALYVIFACLLGAVREQDLLSLPGGTALCRCLRRLGLLRREETEKEGSI